MIFKTKEERRIIKQAKQEAKLNYLRTVAREKAKKDFLESPDDFDFYKELLKGINANPKLKIIIEKTNGTKIILRLTEEENKNNRVSDWINFDAITNSQNEARV